MNKSVILMITVLSLKIVYNRVGELMRDGLTQNEAEKIVNGELVFGATSHWELKDLLWVTTGLIPKVNSN